MLYPLTFYPTFKERIWGGRNLERLYKKSLPPKIPVGESWEISDRPGDESVIANGEWAGKTLHWLMEHHRTDLLGNSNAVRFPLLIKILDAQEKLSLQVHPPAAKAAELGGEPKTEMWFIADATSNADLFVGLKHGVTRAEFETKIKNGTVAECFHRLQVKAGDSIFLPSGRVHAIGAGNVIFEIQQNSDTTYRVFDWNRVDASGKPRELHVAQSLASIDFNDFEPPVLPKQSFTRGALQIRPLVRDPLFSVEACEASVDFEIQSGVMQIIGVLHGKLTIEHEQNRILLEAGNFCLIPACLKNVQAKVSAPVSFLQIRAG